MLSSDTNGYRVNRNSSVGHDHLMEAFGHDHKKKIIDALRVWFQTKVIKVFINRLCGCKMRSKYRLWYKESLYSRKSFLIVQLNS